jgi:hypothetical protein
MSLLRLVVAVDVIAELDLRSRSPYPPKRRRSRLRSVDVDAFLRTLREEVLGEDDLFDVPSLRRRLSRLKPAIDEFESAPYDAGDLRKGSERQELASLLLGANARDLERSPDEAARQLASYQRWTLGRPLEAIVVGLLLRDAQTSRARRRRPKLVAVVEAELQRLIQQSPGWTVETNSYLGAVGRPFDFVVINEKTPILAVQVIFQTRAGGRQTEIFEGLPALQSNLIRHGVLLAIVADGPGFDSMGYVVRRVAPRLPHLMNMSGLEDGELRIAVERAQRVHAGELQVGDPQSEDLLERVATLALRSGRVVDGSLLRLPADETEAFLVRFVASHPEYELETVEGSRVVPARAQEIRRLVQGPPSTAGAPRLAVELIADRLGYRHVDHGVINGLAVAALDVTDARLRLPAPLPVFEWPHEPQLPANVIERIDELLRNGPLVARLGVLVASSVGDTGLEIPLLRGRHSGTQIAVLDRTDVAEILLRRRDAGRRFLLSRIVESVDLSLISPFVSEGPAPETMFFGRDGEIRRIMEQAGRQSYALVGGRKVGKTSILRRLDTLLQGRTPVATLDCQAHPDRTDFLRYLVSQTPTASEVPDDELIASSEIVLAGFVEHRLGRAGGVLLLDEVDDLFFNDSQAEVHRHVLSRAFRSLAQTGLASIVVTGERALYALTRDPSSPHWNFCTPVLIGPLSDGAARNLFLEPMQALGIEVEAEALSLVVERTARHPNLIQFLGDRIVSQLAPESKAGTRLEISAQSVRDNVETPTYRNRFTSTFWSQSTSLEKILSLRLIAGSPQTPDQLLGSLREAGVHQQATTVQEALHFLELYAIANTVPGGYVLREPVFEEFFHPIQGTALERQWLTELTPTN